MSDIYLQITETPTVVTLSAPVISGALSSTVTVANVVTVALDSNSLSALENVTVTVGAAVSISNFPASVTANSNLTATALVDLVEPVRAGVFQWADSELQGIISNSTPVISGTVTVGNSVTIAGTVTANPTGTQTIAGTVTANLGLNAIGPVVLSDSGFSLTTRGMVVVGGISTSDVGSDNEYRELKITSTGEALVRGTVTVGNSVTIGSLPLIAGTVTVGNSLTIQSGNISIEEVFGENSFVPISGTVTVGNSVTIASFATSVTARLINPAGTAVTYAEVGTAGSPSIDVLSVQGVTSGTPLTILNHQGTTVTTSNFTSTTASTVLASANASREVLTIFNEGAGNLHICAGATCTTIAYQVRLSAGDYYEVPLNQTSLTHSAVFATAGTARIVQIS